MPRPRPWPRPRPLHNAAALAFNVQHIHIYTLPHALLFGSLCHRRQQIHQLTR